jgi:formylglycine-generating enzyme required for sulfatase activity
LHERQHQPGIAQIAANPLILTILCVVYWEEQKLPHGRADIYDRCLEVFLRHRTKLRRDPGQEARKPFDPVKARQVLAELAWWLHERKQRGASLEEMATRAAEGLRKVADPAVGADGQSFIKDRMQDECGIIVTSSGERQFLHLTFQEFLAAEHAIAERMLDRIAAGLGDKWWHEPAFHALRRGKEKDASDFFEKLLTGGALAELLAAPNDEFNASGLFGELMRDTTALPSEKFRVFLAGHRSPEEIIRLVVRGLAARPVLVPDLARSVGDLAVRSKDRELRISGALILDRCGLPLPTALAAERDALHIDLRTGITFLRLPAGRFQMGTPWALLGEKGTDFERPVREVTLTQPFWLARHPVTNQEYRVFLEANPDAPKPEYWDEPKLNGEHQPVVGVSWHEALRFCEWAGFRLPTEAEWEYACRAGTRTHYSFGDSPKELREYAWFEENSGGRSRNVGMKRPNPWGLHDMHGNVWEWCQDWFGPYSAGMATDPQGPEQASGRVRRGGSWGSSARFCRSAFRFRFSPESRINFLGFRPVLTLASK